MKLLLSTILLSLVLLSCENDDGLASDVPSFSKLFYGTESLEANDFIEKEDGYLILATIYNNNSSAFYLINTDREGYVLDTIRVKSDTFNTFDRGIALKQLENEVFILGINSSTSTNEVNTNFKSLIFKVDLNGTPIKNNNDTSEGKATIHVIENSDGYPMKMNDFIFSEDKIVLGGTIFNSTNTGEIVQIYNINAFNGSNETVPFEYEYPNQLKIDATNTTVLKVFEGNNGTGKFTTVGQNTISNDKDSPAPPSRNIVRKVYPNFDSPAPFVPRIYSPNQENLGDALKEPVSDTFFYAGSYGTSENNQLTDDLFIIRDDFNPTLQAPTQDGTEKTNKNITEKFGNNVVSIAQNSLGNIYIATTNKIDNINIGPSYLFKLSSSVDLLTMEPTELKSSRFYNIKKIKISQQDDKLLVLSSLEFENNASAVGLMKLNF